jgi:hypothetical protein
VPIEGRQRAKERLGVRGEAVLQDAVDKEEVAPVEKHHRERGDAPEDVERMQAPGHPARQRAGAAAYFTTRARSTVTSAPPVVFIGWAAADRHR